MCGAVVCALGHLCLLSIEHKMHRLQGLPDALLRRVAEHLDGADKVRAGLEEGRALAPCLLPTMHVVHTQASLALACKAFIPLLLVG